MFVAKFCAKLLDSRFQTTVINYLCRKCKKEYSGINCEIMSTALVVRNAIINVTSLIAIIFIVCFILLILFFDYTKYFVMSKRNKMNVKVKRFHYHA